MLSSAEVIISSKELLFSFESVDNKFQISKVQFAL